MLTLDEMAKALGVHAATLKASSVRGELASVAYND